MKNILSELKESNQDFEFYPTTDEIICCIKENIQKYQDKWSHSYKILDIGCGNGNFLNTLEKQFANVSTDDSKTTFVKYGIEKSKILIDSLDKNIIIVGCDFHENTLIDKKMDIIFCNPPYSEFGVWAEKIIKESICDDLYLVIPERWKSNKRILGALKKRLSWFPEKVYREYLNNPVEIIGSYTFEDSEYRKARAKVDVIRICLDNYSESDPFKIWFNDNFDIEFDKPKLKEKEINKDTNSIVTGRNIIERLCQLYRDEMHSLRENYKALESIPYEILKELGVQKSTLQKGLKEKIIGLKNKYWEELFNNLDKITNRLTTKYRERILSTLTKHTSIDVNEENMYSVIIWTIKNANQYQDDQIIDTYKNMTEPEYVELYKSNKHWVKDTWRYNFKKSQTHYKLDYRVVFQLGRILYGRSYHDYENYSGLNKNGYNFILDIFTIANTLGIEIESNQISSEKWERSKQKTFYTKSGEIFAQFRAYDNGNLHAKFNKSFIKKFNIEAGKLNGWIKTPEEASEELKYSMKDVAAHYDCHVKLEPKNTMKLIGT